MSMTPAEHVGEHVWLVCARKDAVTGSRWEPRCVTIVRDGGGLHLLPAWGRIGHPGTPILDLFPIGDGIAAALRANELNLDDARDAQDRLAVLVARLERERETLIAKERG